MSKTGMSGIDAQKNKTQCLWIPTDDDCARTALHGQISNHGGHKLHTKTLIISVSHVMQLGKAVGGSGIVRTNFLLAVPSF